MPKFQMTVQRNHYASIDVEADNEAQAYDLAMAKVASDKTIEWEEDNGSPFGFRSVFVVNIDEMQSIIKSKNDPFGRNRASRSLLRHHLRHAALTTFDSLSMSAMVFSSSSADMLAGSKPSADLVIRVDCSAQRSGRMAFRCLNLTSMRNLALAITSGSTTRRSFPFFTIVLNRASCRRRSSKPAPQKCSIGH